MPWSREQQIIYDSPYHQQLVTAEKTLFGNNFAHTGNKGTAWTRLVPPLGHWFCMWGVPQDGHFTACRLLTFQPRQPVSLFFFFTSMKPGRKARSWLCCMFWLLCTARTVKFVFPQDDICANCNTRVQVNFQPNEEIGSSWLLPTSCHPISPFPLSSFCAFTTNSQVHCPRGSVRSYRTAPPCLRPVQNQCAHSGLKS